MARRTDPKLLEVREARHSQGLLWLLVGVLLVGLPFLGRQRITITSQRISLVSGFWTRLRDDIDVFRIRDVVVRQNPLDRLLDLGDVVVHSLEGVEDRQHVMRSVPNPVRVAALVRQVWSDATPPAAPPPA